MMEKIINVFGSATARAPADRASFRIKLSKLEQLPATAFSRTKSEAEKVVQILRQFDVQDVRSSHIHLNEEKRYYGPRDHRKEELLGYRARIEYHALTRDLGRLDDLLAEIVATGGNEVELSGVDFQTSQLKEIRERVRQQAMRNAVRKAEIYAHEAGASVGPVLQILDKNPDYLRNTNYDHGRHGHAYSEPLASAGGSVSGFYADDDSQAADAVGPGAMISVSAAVDVTFEVGKPLIKSSSEKPADG